VENPFAWWRHVYVVPAYVYMAQRASGKENWRIGPIFGVFFLILSQLKDFFQKSKCVQHPYTRHHLCAKFDILMPSQS